MTPEEADVAAARRLWLEIERCTDSDDERVLIAAALATTRRDAFAAGVEASAKVACRACEHGFPIVTRHGDVMMMNHEIPVELRAPRGRSNCPCDAAAIRRALLPEEARDG